MAWHGGGVFNKRGWASSSLLIIIIGNKTTIAVRGSIWAMGCGFY
jgi:hypothetical protein